MLAVQVSYQGVQETIRHNKIAEEQNARALDQADVKIAQNWVSLEETQRHNIATESETHRHNVETESLGYANLAYNYTALEETKRHNLAQEDIASGSLWETKRHNAAVEGVQWAGIDVQRSQVRETQRANQAREYETYRHNVAQESISREANDIAQYRAVVQEQQGWASLANDEHAIQINQQNANTREYEAETARKRMQADRAIGVWQTILHGIGDTWSNINDTLSIPAKYIKPFGGRNYEQNTESDRTWHY